MPVVLPVPGRPVVWRARPLCQWRPCPRAPTRTVQCARATGSSHGQFGRIVVTLARDRTRTRARTRAKLRWGCDGPPCVMVSAQARV